MKNIYIITILFFLILSCKKETSIEQAKKITIVIQPFSDFPNKYTNSVKKELEKVYSNIKINPKIDFPEHTWNTNKTRRRADKSIKFLTQKAGQNELYIGLTTKDISTSLKGNRDWGVFGLGYRPGKSCIASTFRLKGNKTEKIFKVAIHELGHTQGLPHCPVKKCFMRDAEGKDHLNEETEFCPDCKKVLIKSGWNLK